MSEIPVFVEAAARFQRFLRSEGFPTPVVWAFRDDVWQLGLSRVFVRWPAPHSNLDLVEKVVAEGQAKGLVEIAAIAYATSWTLATVWYPRYDLEEIQGWSEGLKLSIKKPLPVAVRIPRVLWPLLGWLPGFRRYQKTALCIGTREWAAA
jgi:hypothetical protein